MDSHYKLSVIVYVDECGEKFDMFMQTITTNACINKSEIILVCPRENEEDAAQCRKFENQYAFVRCILTDSDSLAHCYNAGLESAKGEWIQFSLSSAFYSNKALDKILKFSDKYYTVNENAQTDEKRYSLCKKSENANAFSLLCMMPYCLAKSGLRVVPYKVRAKRSGVINVSEELDSINLMLQSFVIRQDIAKAIRFNEQNETECLHQYLLELYLKQPVYYSLISAQFKSTRFQETAFTAFEYANAKQWYTETIENFIIPHLEKAKQQYGEVPLVTQIIVYYMIYNKYASNYFERDTGVLNRDEAFAFDNACFKAMQYIEDRVIFNNIDTVFVIPRQFKMHMYRGKYGKRDEQSNSGLPYHIEVLDNHLIYVPNGKSIADYNVEHIDEDTIDYKNIGDTIALGKTYNQEVTIQVIDVINGSLEIDFRFNDEFLRFTDYKIYGVLADHGFFGEDVVSNEFEVLPLTDTEIYSSHKYFGITVSDFRTMHLSAKINRLYGKKLVFVAEINGIRYSLNLRYMRASSRLNGGRMYYWAFEKNHYMKSCRRSIKFASLNPIKHFGLETRFLFTHLFNPQKAGIKDRIYCTALRFVDDITKPFNKKKRIWLTFDKLYKAGDNGEYMFRYCNEQNNGIDCYYIISRDSLDYSRLKKEFGKKILVHESWRQRRIALNAELILATHATVMRYCGFNNKVQKFFKDKFTPIVMCIQHGLTIQKIAQYQNRVYDDTRLYGLASKYEYENINNGIYGFTDKELRMTGLARYDGLKTNDLRQILITPTWRRNVVNAGIAFVKKTHNDSFKNTTYYKIYNGLINDKKLIECANRNGYKIIYLLHPAMSAQLEDYEKNDFVDIVQATGEMSYEKILTESSLMVTDYSGVQFDFAYQRKPVVYYHPDLLPPQYETGKLDFETMGFGPICKNHEQIISTLCNYMENNCQNTEQYIKRANDFFAFSDFNNCERIYKAAIEFLQQNTEEH